LTSPRLRKCAVHLLLLSTSFIMLASSLPRTGLLRRSSSRETIGRCTRWSRWGLLKLCAWRRIPQNTEGNLPQGIRWMFKSPRWWLVAATHEARRKARARSTACDSSGFIGNTWALACGDRSHPTPRSQATFNLGRHPESVAPEEPAERRGRQARVTPSWKAVGSFLQGRNRTLSPAEPQTSLCSMAALEALVFRGYRFQRFGNGHVGSVSGQRFAAGLYLGTPGIQRLQLNVGLFDPVELQERLQSDQYGRPRSRADIRTSSRERSKVVLFVNAPIRSCTSPLLRG